MSDDSFIREVNEELRHDQLRNAWNRFGNYLIAAAILVVLATVGYRGWEYYTTSQAAGSGDSYLAAVELAERGEHGAAIASLRELSQNGYGEYPALARLRIAAEYAREGETMEAIEEYDAIVADSEIDAALRSVARLRAGLLSVDVQNYEQVSERLTPLATAGGQYRSLAREALGVAALEAGMEREAAEWFGQIASDADAPAAVKSRAGIMLDMLAGRGVTQAG
jgi:hypothetical protein